MTINFNVNFNSDAHQANDFMRTTSTESALLHDAIFSDEIVVVRKLIDETPVLVHRPMKDNELPLHAAVRLKRLDSVKFLIAREANPFVKDYQGMTALDYAFISSDPDMLRALLPPNFTKQLDDAQKSILSHKLASRNQVGNTMSAIHAWVEAQRNSTGNPKLMHAILTKDTRTVKHLLKDVPVISSDILAFSLLLGHTKIPNFLMTKCTQFNQTDSSGVVSPMIAAAMTQNTSALRTMINHNGNIFQENIHGVAPAHFLFKETERKDPLHLDKVQLVLGLVSLSSILASYYEDDADPMQASLWKSGIALLGVGAQVAISYHSYLQLQPKSMLAKALYWGTSLATASTSLYLDTVPGARLLWDTWRTCAVAKRAFNQLSVAYNNYAYEPARAAALVGNELLSAGTTFYHTFGTFKQAYDYFKLLQPKFQRMDTLDEDIRQVDKELRQADKAKSDLEKQMSDFKTFRNKLETELDRKGKDLNSRSDAFEKSKAAWISSETDQGKAPICKEVYKTELDHAKSDYDKKHEAFVTRMTHPSLPFLLNPKESLGEKRRGYGSTNQKESAFCALFASEATSPASLSTGSMTQKSINKQFKELGILFHPDKCGKGDSPHRKLCETAYANLGNAKEIALEAIGHKPYTFTCTPPSVSFTIAERVVTNDKSTAECVVTSDKSTTKDSQGVFSRFFGW